MTLIRTREELDALRDEGQAQTYPAATRISVGMATCGISSGARKVYDALAAELKRTGYDAQLCQTGCIGFCVREPLVDVTVAGGARVIYEHVTVDDAVELIAALVAGRSPEVGALCRLRTDHALVTDTERTFPEGANGLSKIPFYEDVPFFKRQVRISLRNSGFIDPDSLAEYAGRGGFVALYKAVHDLTPEEVIAEVKGSGLRGRGGAGFPTGTKWEFCAREESDEKYIICNADEGDPGAFMDRNILEGDPYSVIEGMTIGAYAMGAHKGYVYCRAEYPHALRRLQRAIARAEAHGVLGSDILGSGFSFTLEVRAGAGAFVCGEETALIASIEGSVGEPMPRPPFPAQSGLWGKPTNINNVKTWSQVAPILVRGADWYSAMGTEKSPGTTVFSLVGKVKNTGLVEIPLGVTLREMIFDIGEGVPDGGTFKAVQTGGPSGGCIPAEHLDTPITYEDLGGLGSIMGSGGLIVMDDATCMVDLARYFLAFTEDESCGKCTPCREGTKRMNQILVAICEGRATAEDVATLAELAEYIKDSSLCGLGATAPNPVLTTLQYFAAEYEAHVAHHQCPSLTCPSLSPAPCQSACPAGIDVPSYVALIAAGRYQESLDLIRADNPLPAVCGYVCTHPCEGVCKRADVDTPVAIKDLKRYVTDWELERAPKVTRIKPRKPEQKVAVVGSGPAGLTAAYHLAQAGFVVTIFEAADEPGGMLLLGIPEFRLPRDVIRYEIERIRQLGVEIKTGVRVGSDVTVAELREEGFAAVYLALGAYRESRLNLAGEAELEGVVGSLDFLAQFNRGDLTQLTGRVLVIGGGNAAVDCARTALRLGAEVTVVYRRSSEEMPADPAEVAAAVEEGVELRVLEAPQSLVGDGAKVTGLQCLQTELGPVDESGRRRPVPVAGSQHQLEADLIITAIGQSPDLGALEGVRGVEADSYQRVVVDPRTHRTSVEWIFAGGDVVTGPSTVIEAVYAGKQAARAMGRFLSGEDVVEHAPVPIPRMRLEDATDLSEDELAELSRPVMPTLEVEARRGGFALVELGLDEDTARAESHRCLRCDVNR
jgi:NADH-quinone oxidoreductase subunit F